MSRVLLISDTHLSPRIAHFDENWLALAQWLQAERPALVVNTGDISLDGADRDEDLQFAAAAHRQLGLPTLFLPGNHDVGDHPHLSSGRQVVTEVRLARYKAVFGADRWVHDLDGWRLIGLNGLLIGSGLVEEAAQLSWLRDVVAHAGSQPVAIFLHKPLFLDKPDEDQLHYWCVEPDARRDYASLFEATSPVRLIVSGHLHQYRMTRHGDIDVVWAPSTSFVCGPQTQPDLGGRREVGILELDLGAERAATRFLTPPGLANTVIDPIIGEVYPPVSTLAVA